MMRRSVKLARVVSTVALLAALTACGGAGGTETLSDARQLTLLPQTVAGTLVDSGFEFVTLDDRRFEWPVGADGRFVCTGVQDGDHSLFAHRRGLNPVEIPCRILDGRGLDLGEVTIRDGRIAHKTGFDGYLCGYVDEDGDGVNDRFADEDGDGYCDAGKPLAGYPYMMNRGFADANRDGVNDRYRDRDGDHRSDIDGRHCAPSFGWVDEDGDQFHDLFRDADGDGICDLSGMPFGHHFGYSDDDHDGVNDRFRDADGDCINDLTDEPYICMPGWVDLDDDGRNDFFRDADGDGMHDDPDRPLPYSHGCGWVDANGDGINDDMLGPYADFEYHYGFRMPHNDAQGDGIDDTTGEPYCWEFGWVDADDDGTNDAYSERGGPMMDPDDWPHGNMGMRR